MRPRHPITGKKVKAIYPSDIRVKPRKPNCRRYCGKILDVLDVSCEQIAESCGGQYPCEINLPPDPELSIRYLLRKYGKKILRR